MTEILYILALPFLQLGISFWLSIQTLLMLVMLVRFRRQFAAGFKARLLILPLCVLMIPSLLTGGGYDAVQDALRVTREAALLTLFVAILTGSGMVDERINTKRVMMLSVGLMAFLFLLTLIQYRGLAGGYYIGFPKTAYVNGEGTIPTDLSLRWTHARPSATFSEPSYLSFVVLSLVFAVLPLRRYPWQLAALVGMAIVTGLLSQAASFVIFTGLVLMAWALSRLRSIYRFLLPIGVVAGGAMILPIAAQIRPIARLLNASSSEGDYSTFVRFFGPLSALPEFLIHHPFGVPFSALPSVLNGYIRHFGVVGEQYTNNSLFNLFFEFGLCGFILAAALFLAARDWTTRAFLLSCMLFNGGFFGPDKLAVLAFALCTYTAAMRQTTVMPDPALRGTPVAKSAAVHALVARTSGEAE